MAEEAEEPGLSGLDHQAAAGIDMVKHGVGRDLDCSCFSKESREEEQEDQRTGEN
jgi:hypothetical protein